jgi:short subunit fatty acids transporter
MSQPAPPPSVNSQNVSVVIQQPPTTSVGVVVQQDPGVEVTGTLIMAILVSVLCNPVFGLIAVSLAGEFNRFIP